MSGNDHVKRFNLSEKKPDKPFNLSADRGPPIRDKDNAQPVIPPPRTTFIPHPTLAPPGMMGSRLAADAAKWMKEKRQAQPEERKFKPLAPPGKGKRYTHER